jgi:hypothetical protein
MPDNGKKSKHFKKQTLDKAPLHFGFSKSTSLNKLHSIATMDQLFIELYKNQRTMSKDKGNQFSPASVDAT